MSINWPLVLYSIITDIQDMGLFTSIVILISILVLRFVTQTIDTTSKSKLLKIGITILTSGWVIRSLVYNQLTFVVADLLFQIGFKLSFVPFYSMLFDLSERQDRTSFYSHRMILVNFGTAIPLLLFLLFPYLGLRWILLLMSIFSLGMTLVNKDY